ncbi:hypothetical protein FQA39_LY11002 [Lamprigera yunnana]|nr:hypothetical protein FQA39_LY11002 [Lamprigera yunnana]
MSRVYTQLELPIETRDIAKCVIYWKFYRVMKKMSQMTALILRLDTLQDIKDPVVEKEECDGAMKIFGDYISSKLFPTFQKIQSTISESDISGLKILARLSDYHVYTTLNAKNQFRAPTEWGLCLRPSGVDTEDESPGIRCLACDSERARTCWLTAMRLAKYGKQIRENYRAFKNKQAETINTKEYNSYTVPNESVRSRVAMDFTGSVGRIVEDPKEAKAIAVAEGYSWKRRWRPTMRAPSNLAHVHGIESGVHITQPWFHSGMTRDQATALVNKHGTVDGKTDWKAIQVIIPSEVASMLMITELKPKVNGKDDDEEDKEDGSDGKSGGDKSPPGNGINENAQMTIKPDLRLDMPNSIAQSEHSPATVTTSISRRPAEDSALDYAYDNHAMSNSPSPNSKPHESNF